MTRICWSVTLLFCASWLHAETLMSTDIRHLPLDSGSYVIVHAEILELSAPETSMAQPARARIRIHKVLRGRNLQPRNVDASFTAPLKHEMMIDPKNQNYDIKPEWKTQGFTLPPVGSHVFLAYCCVDLAEENKIGTQSDLVMWSEQAEVDVLKQMAPVPATRKRQNTLFFTILFTLPLAWAIRKLIKENEPVRLALRALIRISAFVLYFFYEAGVPKDSNIRVDLLVLVPILLLNFIGLLKIAIRSLRLYMGRSNQYN
jgi:hypothetical protein